MSENDLGGKTLAQLPIETASLTLRAFVPEDMPKAFQMSQEDAMRTWLPSQVYRDEAHAASITCASKASLPHAHGPRRFGPYSGSYRSPSTSPQMDGWKCTRR